MGHGNNCLFRGGVTGFVRDDNLDGIYPAIFIHTPAPGNQLYRLPKLGEAGFHFVVFIGNREDLVSYSTQVIAGCAVDSYFYLLMVWRPENRRLGTDGYFSLRVNKNRMNQCIVVIEASKMKNIRGQLVVWIKFFHSKDTSPGSGCQATRPFT